jgi:hypothetical protein
MSKPIYIHNSDLGSLEITFDKCITISQRKFEWSEEVNLSKDLWIELKRVIDKHFESEEAPLLWYQCETCSNKCLTNPAPNNSHCGGCDKPNWILMKEQESYKAE